jgi:3D (Asp-Asp-Asp) domain-containing protein
MIIFATFITAITNLFSTTSYQELIVYKTAYCLSGHTRTGTTVHHGTIATDPGVIPLGSKVFVPGYGWGKAEDTGSAINGLHIDVWMKNCDEALAATRQHVHILVGERR